MMLPLDKIPQSHEELDDYVDTVEEDEQLFADFKDLDPADYKGDDAAILSRWQQLWELQEHYADFRDFYRDCSMDLLGFEPTEMQYDIADYCQKSPLYAMIQAQRGEAKTTITGAYAVWCLIHNPGTIILIVSAGGDLAKDIANWIIQILNGMPVLECMRPDKNHPTTRTSLEKYDIHHDLKGVNKSPSVACCGITSSMQGKRAHLLIADDVESSKNSQTQVMRDQLLEKTRDFISINRDGKILYLGTPQSNDSIYNTLPGRGYEVRIWPGRIPNAKEEAHYGPHLAPFIKQMIKEGAARTGCGMLGTRGAPSDPGMMSEQGLIDREIDQGPAYFNLQYMLDTELADADRYPLKALDLMHWPLDLMEAPGQFMWGPTPENKLDNVPGLGYPLPLHRPANVRTEAFPYEQRILALDPAGEGGKNRDETGYAVVFTANGYYFLMEVGGIVNASGPEGLAELSSLIHKWQPHNVIVEKNHGGGIFKNVVEGLIVKESLRCGVEEVWSSGQKELRIMHAVQPIVASHKLVVNAACHVQDHASVQKYPLELRKQYSFFFQFMKLTRERGALIHDDRLDALAIALRYLKDTIKVDAQKKVREAATRVMLEWMANPRGITTRNPKKYRIKPSLGHFNGMQKFERN